MNSTLPFYSSYKPEINLCWQPEACFNIKTIFHGVGIPIIKSVQSSAVIVQSDLITILHTTLRYEWQKVNQILENHNKYPIPRRHAWAMVSVLSILKKIGRVITAPCCTILKSSYLYNKNFCNDKTAALDAPQHWSQSMHVKLALAMNNECWYKDKFYIYPTCICVNCWSSVAPFNNLV